METDNKTLLKICKKGNIKTFGAITESKIVVRLKIPTLMRILLLVFSFPFIAILTSLLIHLVHYVVDIEVLNALLTLSGIAFWLFLNNLGPLLKIDNLNNFHSVFAITSYYKKQGLPFLQITSEKTADRWKSVLSHNGVIISHTESTKSEAESTSDLKQFAELFSSDNDVSGVENNEADTALPDVISEREKTVKVPPKHGLPQRLKDGRLIILVHGTFGARSKWTHPGSSLIEALSHATDVSDKIVRFPWSGKNTSSDRNRAASSLAEFIKSKLDAKDREIVVIAHSHAGNIAINMCRKIGTEYAEHVKLCLLSAPFLKWRTRFKVINIYNMLPEALKDNFQAINVFAFWFFSLVLYSLFQDSFISAEYRITLLGGMFELWPFIIFIIVFFTPPLVFLYVWNSFKRVYESLPQADNSEPDIILHSGIKQMLVITYDQDEAFQGLSALINLFALFQQAIFALVVGIVNITKGFRFLGAGMSVAYLILFLSIIAVAATWGLMALVVSLGILPDQLVQSIGRYLSLIGEYVDIVSQYSFAVFAFMVLLFGGLCLVVCTAYFIFGLIRYIILNFAGVTDQITNQDEFLEAILGSLTISIVPEGNSQIEQLTGDEMFNHTSIYDDERTHNAIIEFIDFRTSSD